MHMIWHHLLFDVAHQVGSGEYTYAGHNRYHGIVIVQVQHGQIHRWREYQYQSPLDWATFVGDSHFAESPTSATDN